MIFGVTANMRAFLAKRVTAQLHLSGLIGTASHPDTHKIRVIGFFLNKGLHWHSEVKKKKSRNGCFGLHICLHTNKTLMCNSLFVFDKWGEKFKP